MWSADERKRSSTWREMFAIKSCLETFQYQLVGKVVKWFTDCLNCIHIIQTGSSKPDLHQLAMSIFSVCVKNSIYLDIQWIPRDQNVQADSLSRIFDYDDWSVTDEFFHFIDNLFGPHTCDRFADSNNNKIARFNSKFYTQGTSGVDAFAFNWVNDNNWSVPPINLISRVIKHSVACKARCTLVVPKWISASYWPLLFQSNMLCQSYIADMLEFKDTRDIYKHGSNKKSLFGSDKFTGSVLVVRIVP
ncbi:uncharacterized protein LOC134704601 [Mytilus trossulus]|uniref:uncharacterized protein LOC134704601 n=1 Tax=Mytilus trossulus TaxID=6551 RepID=UPI003007DC2F